jgi:hypothetical protein
MRLERGRLTSPLHLAAGAIPFIVAFPVLSEDDLADLISAVGATSSVLKTAHDLSPGVIGSANHAVFALGRQ